MLASLYLAIHRLESWCWWQGEEQAPLHSPAAWTADVQQSTSGHCGSLHAGPSASLAGHADDGSVDPNRVHRASGQ